MAVSAEVEIHTPKTIRSLSPAVHSVAEVTPELATSMAAIAGTERQKAIT